MFLAIFIAILAVLGLALFYLLSRVRDVFLKGRKPKEVEKKERIRAWLLALIPVAALILWCVIKPYVAVLVALHLVIFLILMDLGFFIWQKATKKKGIYWIPIALAVVITAVYMSIAYFLAVHVYKTQYQLTTDKEIPDIRIALIADSHIGTTFDGEGFAEHMKKIEAQHPDLLVITGDFVDDDTKRVDMERACEALGSMETTYGVFYSPGNHDDGYSEYRDFTYEDLLETLEKNGVYVLEDEVVEIDTNLYVVGRKDRSMNRLPIEDLVAPLGPDAYTIVLDHQPNDYDAEAAAGCGLVVSGHTHGGQMIPIGHVGELFGFNDATYGLHTRKETDFIVTSGIADWAIPFKTGTISEYVIIDVKGK